MRAKELARLTWLPVLLASLCCLTPVIFVLFGLSTVAIATSLADILNGEYEWLFRLVGLVLLATSFVVYLRRERGICTISDVKKRRREIINLALIVFSAGVIGYVIFLYVIVELAGVALGIWSL